MYMCVSAQNSIASWFQCQASRAKVRFADPRSLVQVAHAGWACASFVDSDFESIDDVDVIVTPPFFGGDAY